MTRIHKNAVLLNVMIETNAIISLITHQTLVPSLHATPAFITLAQQPIPLPAPHPHFPAWLQLSAS